MEQIVVKGRSTPLGPRPEDVARQIRQAIFGLKADLQRERDLRRELVHRALITALHTDSLWEKAKWR